MTKERFRDKPNLSTLSKTLRALKIHASMNCVSTFPIPKLGCGLDQMNWQEVVKLLRDIFAYADVQLVVYTLEENGVHALSAEGDAEFNADDDIEVYIEEFLLENLFWKQTLLNILNPVNRPVTSNSQSSVRQILTADSLITIFNISQKHSLTTLKNSTSSTQTLPRKK